jgi:hypothetical protein
VPGVFEKASRETISGGECAMWQDIRHKIYQLNESTSIHLPNTLLQGPQEAPVHMATRLSTSSEKSGLVDGIKQGTLFTSSKNGRGPV